MTSQISFNLHVLKNEFFKNKTIARYRETECECVLLKILKSKVEEQFFSRQFCPFQCKENNYSVAFS